MADTQTEHTASAAPRPGAGAGRRPLRPAMQDYRNRDYVQHFLDLRAFAALTAIGGDAVALATTGCLDALAQLPAGSVVAISDANHDQSLVVRGRCAAELRAREELARKLVAQLLDDGDPARDHRTRTRCFPARGHAEGGGVA